MVVVFIDDARYAMRWMPSILLCIFILVHRVKDSECLDGSSCWFACMRFVLFLISSSQLSKLSAVRQHDGPAERKTLATTYSKPIRDSKYAIL